VTRQPLPHHFEDRLQRFESLMSRRVRNLLLVASAYDYYILEQEGQLDEPILTEFTDVNIGHTPSMQRVPSGRKTLDAIAEGRADLVVTTGNLGDMTLREFLRRARNEKPDVPVVLLAFDTLSTDILDPEVVAALDGVFAWQGDFRILFAIVKFIEDAWNVDADIEHLGVSAILLIEDNVRYYSSFLPMFYSEVLSQSQRVIPEGLNLSNKMRRMRARPKILLCTNYEDAWSRYQRYRRHILGVFSDVAFPRKGRLDPEAGFHLARRVREENPDLPFMLHTQDAANQETARDLRVSIALKDSPTLLQELRSFMVDNFGFSDFVFRLDDGSEVGRAKDLRMLEEQLAVIPRESIYYHAQRNHFSTWLKARTEFSLSEALREVKVSDFASLDEMRAYLIESIREFRKERHSGGIAAYDAKQFDAEVSFAKIGSGSMGGKARGLAFLRQIVYNFRLRNRIPGVRVFVPPSLVLTTDVFDQFIDANDLRDFALKEQDDRRIQRRFVEARFPKRALNKLKRYLESVDYPLAVRSSSLLEDSQYQPFAGIYSTFLLPNNSPNPRERLRSLLVAIKRTYASTYSREAKAYIKNTTYRLEEEKMAVIVEQLVGRRRGRYFYPDIAGVAQSYNYYATPPASPGDGVVAVGLGLGQQVVSGGAAVRFSPRYPEHLPQFSSPRDILRHAQSTFYALDMEDETLRTGDTVHLEPTRLPITIAYEAGALQYIGSMYDHSNNAVHDGLSRPGAPVITFAPILKKRRFPLPEVAELLLEVGSRGMNAPVVMEFAANLDADPKEFACLQLRPMVTQSEPQLLRPVSEDPERILCRSARVLGNGRITGIRDLVVVDRDRFDRARSHEAAEEVGRFNAALVDACRPYILIGVGRWGASDPWLGVPVTWDQIAGAKVIVEAGFAEVAVEPSQGSHFFHNLVAGSVGYFCVGELATEEIDWEWLAGLPVVESGTAFRHIRTEAPLVVKMQGRRGDGVILKF